MLVVGKEASTLSTLHGIANCVKNGTARKIVSSNRRQRPQQCRPQQLSVKFENLVHSIFRNEDSALEINVSHFGVLHWQQWQPPASAPAEGREICKHIEPKLHSHLEESVLSYVKKIVVFTNDMFLNFLKNHINIPKGATK